MVDIKKIRIRKTTYSFDINKMYDYIQKFRIIEKNPLELFMESIKKKKEVKKGKKKEKKKKSINPMLIGGIIGLMIILFVGAWLIIATSTEELVPTEDMKSIMEIRIIDGETITYGETGDGLHTGKIILEQGLEGFENTSLTLTTYREEPPYQIYIIDEPRDKSQTTTYDEFKSSLTEMLKKKGKTLNTIDSNKLKTVPRGSLVIVPTARIPESLIKEGESNLKNMLERGVHILYIGKEFDNAVDEYGDVIVSDEEDVEKVGINFVGVGEASTLEYLFQPQYIAKGENEIYNSRTAYGVVSIIKHAEGKGYLIMIPQTLDSGWSYVASEAAEDVSRVIDEMKWLEVDSTKEYEIETKNETIVKTYFTEPFQENTMYVKVYVEGIKNKEAFGETRYIRVDKKINGELYITDGEALVSTSISGEPITIKADLKEETSGQQIYPYISVLKDEVEVKKESLLNNKISTHADSDFKVQLDINEGEHSAQILDEHGNRYAEGYINSVGIELTKKSDDNNVFTFSFKVEGKPKVLKEINVTVDDGELGEYYFTESSEVSIDLNEKLGFGGELSVGEHIFEFNIGELQKEHIETVRGKTSIFTSIWFIGAVVLALGALGVGSFLAAQRKPEYYIDIPDFPPAEFTKITVSKDLIMNVFEKENEYHKWKNTPLTLSEIRGGLRKTFYKGRHLNTSDFNMSYILDKLKKMGLVEEEFDYYLPKKWISKEETARYLTMFRRLRDVCVVNAVPFTKKHLAKNCDSKITVIGQEMYLHVYGKNRILEIMKNLIKNTREGLNIVLVKNEYEKNKFRELLTAPTKAASILKFENEGDTISIMNLDEFEKMIKEMKT